MNKADRKAKRAVAESSWIVARASDISLHSAELSARRHRKDSLFSLAFARRFFKRSVIFSLTARMPSTSASLGSRRHCL